LIFVTAAGYKLLVAAIEQGCHFFGRPQQQASDLARANAEGFTGTGVMAVDRLRRPLDGGGKLAGGEVVRGLGG
jgi:hypothetical protein